MGNHKMISLSQQRIDQRYMSQALDLARRAGECGEVPVGAVVVFDDAVVGTGFNRCVNDHDPSAHAEVLALREAAKTLKNFRLDGASLYVTLEPCMMCCGALLQARIARLIFGARQPRTGAVVSIHESLCLPKVDHHVAISEGPMAVEAARLMHEFFEELR